MKRSELLDQAKETVTKDRNDTYGEPEDNFGTIAIRWETYIRQLLKKRGTEGRIILPADVAAMMIDVKLSRIGSGKNDYDNWRDTAGYAACGAELTEE